MLNESKRREAPGSRVGSVPHGYHAPESRLPSFAINSTVVLTGPGRVLLVMDASRRGAEVYPVKKARRKHALNGRGSGYSRHTR